MAISTLAEYKAALGVQRTLESLNVPTVTTVAGRLYDLWTTAVPVGAAPTTAVVPTSATAGALGQLNPSSGQLSILGARFSALNPGVYLVCDRLSHQGGLAGNSAAAQTTNLPTAALTRYTDGVGVMIGLTIYTQIGTTASSVTCSYTNTVPTSGRTSLAVVIGGTGFREVPRMVLLPLASGDVGCTAVASVTLSASTLTAGNFGVTLFKPIYAIHVTEGSGVLSAGGFISGNTGGGVPVIQDNACLFLMCLMMGTNANGSGALLLGEN